MAALLTSALAACMTLPAHVPVALVDFATPCASGDALAAHITSHPVCVGAALPHPTLTLCQEELVSLVAVETARGSWQAPGLGTELLEEASGAALGAALGAAFLDGCFATACATTTVRAGTAAAGIAAAAAAAACSAWSNVD